MVRRIGVLLAITLVAMFYGVQGAAARPRPLPLELHNCGDTITRSIRLGNDLVNCPAAALVLQNGLSNATLDLNGHRITASGANTSVGITLDSGNTNFTIKNGVLSGFAAGAISTSGEGGTFSGLLVTGTTSSSSAIAVQGNNNTVENNVLTRNSVAIELQYGTGSSGSTIRNNLVAGNVLGIGVVDSDGNNIAGNTAIGDGAGIIVNRNLHTADDNVISGNEVVGSQVIGIGLTQTTNTQVTGNSVRATAGDGIDLQSESGDEIGDGTAGGTNTVSANKGNGIAVVGSFGANSIMGNVIEGNLADGIKDDVFSSFESIRSNTVNENGANGIEANNTPAALSNNVANLNGYANGVDGGTGLGIKAGVGTTDSSNTAQDNSASAQCSPTTACTAGTKTAPTLKTCGAAITADFTLKYPLDCASSGFGVTGSGTTLDLGDHYFQVDASTAVVNVSTDNVTVNGGVLQSADRAGVAATGATNLHVNSTIVNGGTEGFSFDAASTGGVLNGVFAGGTGAEGVSGLGAGLVVEGSRFVGVQAGDAIALVGPSGPTGDTVTTTDVIGTLGVGLLVSDLANSHITNNRIIGSMGDGINEQAFSSGSSANVFSGNVIQGGNAIGFDDVSDGAMTANAIGDSHINVAKNTITQNASGGIFFGTDPDSTHDVVQGNKVSDNGGDAGIDVASDLAGMIVKKNRASDNEFDGIKIESSAPGMRVNQNGTNHNGFLNGDTDPAIGHGIDAPANVRGCGDVARHNEAKAQLIPARLRKPC